MMELIEKEYVSEKKLIKSPKLDGIHKERMMKHLSNKYNAQTAKSMFKNAYRALPFYADSSEEEQSHILCIGKVQSGKTSFFTASIALAFDNGYGIAYLLSGTKNTLMDQNETRMLEDFEHNEDIIVVPVNDVSDSQIKEYLSRGKKVIVVVLKNTAIKRNLGKMFTLEENLGDIPSLIVDDEADEVTPGAPAKKNKGKFGRTHDVIVEIKKRLKCCTYLSVTATPEANMLLETYDELSPDFVSLVYPGEGYTGGNSFHDTMDNPHVVEIKDSDNFENGVIPDSFKDALYDFIFSCCLKNDGKQYSMLVHPSHRNDIQNQIAEQITKYLNNAIENLKEEGTFAYNSSLEQILIAKNRYESLNDVVINDSVIINRVKEVVFDTKVYVYNYSLRGKESIKTEKDSEYKYKIYVGGNMLGRGLTLTNLIITYIYRDSKVSAIDTLYQRARWLGYKEKYFDVCKVYMTKLLKEKFIATVDSENDMWSSIESFLENKSDFKQFPRILMLNYQNSQNDKLILTRESITKTVEINRVDPGFTYDKSIHYKNSEDRSFNRKLYNSFLIKYEKDGHPEKLGKGKRSEESLLIKMKFSEFYDEFLKDYKYPYDTKFGLGRFNRILADVNENKREDEILVIVMRYKHMEYRDLGDPFGYTINELLQGRSNDGVSYIGDKNIYMSTFHIQIHLVYQDDKEDFVPMLAMRNPVTLQQARYVTGDQL